MTTGGSLAGLALEAVVQQKKALRTLMRRRLKAFDAHLRAVEDETIQKHVLSAEWFKKSKCLCAYLTCSALREVETSQIVAKILEQHDSDKPRKLFVPRIEDKHSHMSLLRISNTVADVAANSMNILEPTVLDADGNPREDVMSLAEPVDLLLLPGLAFDRQGRRLGRGGGYYDHFLRNYMLRATDKGWEPPLLVALAYSVQVLDEPIPMDETDVPVDAVVSLDGVHSFTDRVPST